MADPVLSEMEPDSIESRTQVIKCNCCFDIISTKAAISLADCTHIYCSDCIRTMFSMAIKDESSFPPKCCATAIDIKSVKHLLHRPQVKAYERVALEYTTPGIDRRYCADSRCNSFLGRANNGLLRCDKCGNLTCDFCKDHAHSGPCTVERGRDVHKLDADLEKLAVAEGWQRCSSCSKIVDLRDGCNHVTCRCKHQFCYSCGAEWKTCECPQYPRPGPHQEPIPRQRLDDLAPGYRPRAGDMNLRERFWSLLRNHRRRDSRFT